MPYLLTITTGTQETGYRTTSLRYNDAEAVVKYLTDSAEIWSSHWMGWGEADAAPAAPSLTTIQSVGMEPVTVMMGGFSDGFNYKVVVAFVETVAVLV